MSSHVSQKLKFRNNWSSQSDTVSRTSCKESRIHVAVSKSMSARWLDCDHAGFRHGKARRNGSNDQFFKLNASDILAEADGKLRKKI